MRDMRTLETFYWVATLGGFRAAAQHLNTTQPAISARIAQLEEELGVRLFDRQTKRITLTNRGAVLLSYSEKIFQIRTEMLQAVSDNGALLRGTFRLGVSETLVHTWLSPLLERIRALYPQISLDISVDTTVEIHKQLLSLDLDLGLVAAPLDHPDARSLKLCAYPFRLLVSPAFRAALPANATDRMLLTRYPIITYPKSALSTKNLIAVSQERLGLANLRIWGISPITTIIDMARTGLGIAALSPVSIPKILAAGELETLPSRLPLEDLSFYSTYLPGPNAFLKEAIRDLALEAAEAFSATTARTTGHPD
ncbi:LysR family transcriptional regulator [Alcaligenaceae bacterium SJ-26]|nr:LysR family transcriptional regulator [Alcaligenaceae bacterium SJ-26]